MFRVQLIEQPEVADGRPSGDVADIVEPCTAPVILDAVALEQGEDPLAWYPPRIVTVTRPRARSRSYSNSIIPRNGARQVFQRARRARRRGLRGTSCGCYASVSPIENWSGRGDSNSRSLDPQSSAITRLRYVPTSDSTPIDCGALGGRAPIRAATPATLPRAGFRAFGRHRPHARRRQRAAARDGTRRLPVGTRQQLENRPQPALDGRQPLARVLADQLVDGRRLGRHRRGFLAEAPPGARQRQPVDEQQMLDPQHLLDIGAAIRSAPCPRCSRRRASGNSASHERST